jgi:hypothetical protein
MSRFALLIGITDYSNLSPQVVLWENNLSLIHQALINSSSFNDIQLVYGQQATFNNIMNRLSSLTNREEDFIFLYYTGHGISDYRINSTKKIGALVTRENRLIWGDTDISPILSQLDNQGKSVFVLFDTCYSEFTCSTNGFNYFPYNDVIYISGSSCDEEALGIDIDFMMRSGYITYQNVPLGLLTDLFLKGLYSGQANMMHDNRITLIELKEYIYSNSQISPIGKPQFLGITRSKYLISLTEMFGLRQSPLSFIAPYTLRLNSLTTFGAIKTHQLTNQILNKQVICNEKISKNIKKQVKKNSNLILDNKNYELDLIHKKGEHQLIINHKRLLSKSSNQDETIIRIKRHIWINRLMELKNLFQTFLFSAELLGTGKYGYLEINKKLKISIWSNRSIYLLSLKIDVDGIINVIKPKGKFKSNKKGMTKIIDLGKIKKPLGTQYIKIFGFPRMTKFYKNIKEESFDPLEKEPIDFIRAILKIRSFAETSIQFSVVEKKKAKKRQKPNSKT